jgi:hypothetical protein
LLLKNLVNGKYFLVNRKYFSVKEKFGLVFKKVFFFLAVFVFRKVVSEKSLSKLSCVCLPAVRKVGQRKTLSSQRKIWLDFQESVFLKNLGGKHFSGSCEKFRNVIIC